MADYNIRELRSLGGEKHQLRNELPRIEEIPKFAKQWLTNEKIAAFLFFAHSNITVIAKEVKLRPENGSLILYSKKDCNYKADGYSWKKRKEGKVIREDHMRLKVKGIELIHANYVHSSLISTFHRRAYCLSWSSDITLVHYLNTLSVCSNHGTDEEDILNNLRQCAEATALGDEDIVDQIVPILRNCDPSLTHSSNLQEIPDLRIWLEKILTKWRSDGGAIYDMNLPPTPAVESNFHELALTQSLSSGRGSFLTPTSSTFSYKDDSESCIVKHASCVFTDAADVDGNLPLSLFRLGDVAAASSEQFCGDDSAYCSINDCSSENNDNLDVVTKFDATQTACASIVTHNEDSFLGFENYCGVDGLESLTFPCFPNENVEDGDLSQIVFSRREINDLLESSENFLPKKPTAFSAKRRIHCESDNTSTARNITRDQSISSDSRPPHNIPYSSPTAALTITDFSPNWAYCDGGEKILITGGNFQANFQYECSFDDQLIGAHYVQPGVLKCVCPQTYFLRGLNERLNCLLDILKSGSELQPINDIDLLESYFSNSCNAGLLETDLLELFSLISPKMLKRKGTDTKAMNRRLPHHYGLTFAHLVARLGYDKLLARFVDYEESDSDFSLINTDAFDRMPLVWSCLHNKISTAVFLSTYSSHCLLKRDRIHKKLPLSVSYERGHFDLIQKVSSEFVRRYNNDITEKDLDTAVWILTGGLVTRNHFFPGKQPQKIESHNTSLCDHLNLFDAGCSSFDSSDSDISFEECSIARPECSDNSWSNKRRNRSMQEASADGQTGRVKIISFAQNIIESFPRQKSCIGSHNSFVNLEENEENDSDSESLALDSFSVLTSFHSPVNARDFSSPTLGSKIGNARDEPSLKSPLSPRDIAQDHVPNGRLLGRPSFALSNSSSSADFRRLNCPMDQPATSLQCSCFGTQVSSISRQRSLSSFCNGQRTTADFDAFLNGLVPVQRAKSSLEFDFQRLSLSDREQRELYEAAKVIQNAFRQYKQRIQTRRQLEAEKHAATVIQSYYRRYKQFCYFKKVHRAAALIQKHFRTYKANKRKRSPDDDISATDSHYDHNISPSIIASDFSRSISNATKRTISMPFSDCSSSGTMLTNDTDFRNSFVDCTRNDHNYDKSAAANSNFDSKRVIQVTADEMQIWKEQLAAIRIQHAFRGHAKRQAAARTIQRFMRRTKQRLRETAHPANIESSTMINTNSQNGYQSMPSSL